MVKITAEDQKFARITNHDVSIYQGEKWFHTPGHDPKFCKRSGEFQKQEWYRVQNTQEALDYRADVWYPKIFKNKNYKILNRRDNWIVYSIDEKWGTSFYFQRIEDEKKFGILGTGFIHNCSTLKDLKNRMQNVFGIKY